MLDSWIKNSRKYLRSGVNHSWITWDPASVGSVADYMRKTNTLRNNKEMTQKKENRDECQSENLGWGEQCAQFGTDVDDIVPALLLVLLLGGIRAWGTKARKHEMPRAHDTQSVNNNLHLRRYLNIVARQKQHRHQPTSGKRETTVACPRGHSHGQRYE